MAAAAALLFAAVALLTESAAALPAWLALGGFTMVLVVVDIRHHLLPDALVGPALLVGILTISAHGLAAGDPWVVSRALAGSAALFLLYLTLALISPSGMGMGDVKLASVAGLYLGSLGWGPWILGAAAGPAIGAIIAACMLVLHPTNRDTEVAFGPAMLTGVFTVFSLVNVG
ncbi:hypothetical protein GCM10011374_39860 [Kocuria dechangensis]|uniref:Prepilin type IV endopeptidase peptidase domain-containing protein n=1 Tax=Kocuria dechangensis TaxID=1176249 RepID=A0A917M1G0_9MICC|nr:hypothetical protein GCM10011374_39860 [Kocuria dechangensis]